MLSLRWEIKKKQQHYDFWNLHHVNCQQSFDKQILMNLLINFSIRCFIFKSSPAECLRNYILHVVSKMFAKNHSWNKKNFKNI